MLQRHDCSLLSHCINGPLVVNTKQIQVIGKSEFNACSSCCMTAWTFIKSLLFVHFPNYGEIEPHQTVIFLSAQTTASSTFVLRHDSTSYTCSADIWSELIQQPTKPQNIESMPRLLLLCFQVSVFFFWTFT